MAPLSGIALSGLHCIKYDYVNKVHIESIERIYFKFLNCNMNSFNERIRLKIDHCLRLNILKSSIIPRWLKDRRKSLLFMSFSRPNTNLTVLLSRNSRFYFPSIKLRFILLFRQLNDVINVITAGRQWSDDKNLKLFILLI